MITDEEIEAMAWEEYPANYHNAPNEYYRNLIRTAFIEGAKDIRDKLSVSEHSSDDWISVEKDLPDEEQVILVNNNDCVELSIYRGKKFICIHWFNHWRKVTHWLPIPPKPPVKDKKQQ